MMLSGEGFDVARDELRELDVEAVPAVAAAGGKDGGGVALEDGVGDERVERELILEREDAVVVAPEDEGRRSNFIEFGGVVFGDHPRERLFPDRGRKFEAFGDGCVEKLCGNGVGESARLKIAHEPWVNGVYERLDGFVEGGDHLVARHHGRAADEHEAPDAARVFDGELVRDETAHRVADDGCLLDLQRVHEGRDIGGEVPLRVAAGGAGGVAVAALVERVDVKLVGDERQVALKRAPRIGVAVQEDYDAPVAAPAFDVVHVDASVEGDVAGSESEFFGGDRLRVDVCERDGEEDNGEEYEFGQASHGRVLPP